MAIQTQWTNDNGSVTTTLDGERMMSDCGEWELEFTEKLEGMGYVNGVDFEWHTAMGDDIAHAITITNKDIIANKELMSEMDAFEGRSCYD